MIDRGKSTKFSPSNWATARSDECNNILLRWCIWIDALDIYSSSSLLHDTSGFPLSPAPYSIWPNCLRPNKWSDTFSVDRFWFSLKIQNWMSADVSVLKHFWTNRKSCPICCVASWWTGNRIWCWEQWPHPVAVQWLRYHRCVGEQRMISMLSMWRLPLERNELLAHGKRQNTIELYLLRYMSHRLNDFCHIFDIVKDDVSHRIIFWGRLAELDSLQIWWGRD